MSKGKDFEREIAKDMSLWLTNGEDQDTIWYTKSSGGRATRRIQAHQVSSRFDHGDLGPDGSKAEYFFETFSCELKTGYGKKGKKQTTLWAVMDIIDSQQQTPMFYDFWWQAVNDAQESNREPILIFRRNRRTACIAMNHYVFNSFMSCKNTKPEFDIMSIDLSDYEPAIRICNLRNFFDYTWSCINENFIRFRVNRAILLYEKRGKLL